MLLLLFISIVVSLLIGWTAHWLFNRVRLELKARKLIVPGESGKAAYQRYKKNLKPIEPPPGTLPEAAERFRKLSPLVQHRVMAARKKRGLDG